MLNSVYKAFEKSYGTANKDVMIKRLLSNQTVNLMNKDEKFKAFETDKDIKDFLRTRSKIINPIDVKELARGGEAVVYRISHTGIDEVVAKCSLSQSAFKDIMEETHTLKLLKNENYICQIKEEIIDYD